MMAMATRTSKSVNARSFLAELKPLSQGGDHHRVRPPARARQRDQGFVPKSGRKARDRDDPAVYLRPSDDDPLDDDVARELRSLPSRAVPVLSLVQIDAEEAFRSEERR